MVQLMHKEKGTENLPVIFISAIGYDDFHRIKGIGPEGWSNAISEFVLK